jgi:hypothetical protein
LVPFTVKVNVPRPAVLDEGLRLEIVGVGLLTVKVRLPDVPPPGSGLVTDTFRGPAVLIADAGTVTAIVVGPMLLGVMGPLPPKVTVAPLTKFVPVIVSWKLLPPAIAEFGLKLEIVGTGLSG